MKKYLFYDANGAPISVTKIPPQWLPAKGHKYVLVFTTPECSMKQSKQMSGKDDYEIGMQFWLKSGERMEVVDGSVVNHGKWQQIFGSVDSYKECGEIFLCLDEASQAEFSELPLEIQFAYLKVPKRAQNKFVLREYCDRVAHQEERRKQEKEQQRREEMEKILKGWEKQRIVQRALHFDDDE